MHNLLLTSFYVALLQFVTYDLNILAWIYNAYLCDLIFLKFKYLTGSNSILYVK